jgi:hypothetical protein
MDRWLTGRRVTRYSGVSRVVPQEFGRMTTQLNITEDYIITDGPSREELFDALRLFNEQRRVLFTLKKIYQHERRTYTLPAVVLGVKPEDGSGHNWCLELQFSNNAENGIVLGEQQHEKFGIYYHDQRRKGTIADARPFKDRICVDRNGVIWRGPHRVGSLSPSILSS